MKNMSLIELSNPRMKFSAAHFTLFSATERERLHGHNYNVELALLTEVDEIGLSFDYRLYLDKVMTLCGQLNQSVLLPQHSKFLTLSEDADYIIAEFNQQKMPFLKTDTTLLPLTNITLEELSQWFLNQLKRDVKELNDHQIKEITVKVKNGPGQSGACTCVLS